MYLQICNTISKFQVTQQLVQFCLVSLLLFHQITYRFRRHRILNHRRAEPMSLLLCLVDLTANFAQLIYERRKTAHTITTYRSEAYIHTAQLYCKCCSLLSSAAALQRAKFGKRKKSRARSVAPPT